MSSDSAGSTRSLPLAPERFQPGESILIAGPAMTGKRRLLFTLLGQTADQSAILVSTKHHAERFRQEFSGHVSPDDGWELRTVDCVSKSRGVRTLPESPDVTYVSSPRDLTGIGIAASGFMREFHHANRDARIGLHSLSTLLMYADLQRVFQFSHVITGRIEASNFGGVFTLDTAHNTEAVSTLQGLFDVFIQIRDSDEAPELRVRGSDLGPRKWTQF